MTAQILIVNASTLVSDVDAAAMVRAVATQVRRDVAPAWGIVAADVVLVPGKTAPAGRVITIVDTLDEADALGWHTEEARGHVFGVVGCKTVLDHGAKPLAGPYSVASILSHEVIEMAVDPTCGSWADTGKGVLIATEACDPVQSDHYDIDGVTISNFVLPAWFDPHTPRGQKVDQMGLLRAPFTIRPGGYLVQMRSGQVTQRFGEGMPPWLVDMKLRNPRSRTNRRATS